MSRFLLLLCAASLIAACEQPVVTTKSSTVPKTVSTPSGARSDQDICYEKHSVPGHDHQRSIAACDRLIATGEYQGFTLAKIYAERGVELRLIYKYSDSVASFEKAIEIRPDYDYAYQQKAASLYYIYRHQEALEAAQRAVELDPEDSTNVAELGFALRKMKRFDEAQDQLELALALNPDDVWITREMGWNLRDQHRYEEALDQFRKALELGPEEAWSHYAIGYVLVDLDREREAIAAFDRSIKLEPRKSSFYNLRGYTQLIENADTFDVDLATRDFEKAVQIDPTNEFAHHHLAAAYAYAGRGSEALEQLRKGIRIKPIKKKIRRVIRILWDKKLTEDAKAASELLKQIET